MTVPNQYRPLPYLDDRVQCLGSSGVLDGVNDALLQTHHVILDLHLNILKFIFFKYIQI